MNWSQRLTLAPTTAQCCAASQDLPAVAVPVLMCWRFWRPGSGSVHTTDHCRATQFVMLLSQLPKLDRHGQSLMLPASTSPAMLFTIVQKWHGTLGSLQSMFLTVPYGDCEDCTAGMVSEHSITVCFCTAVVSIALAPLSPWLT